MFSLMALLRPLTILPSFTAAELLIVLTFAYYLTLDLRLAIGMLLVSSALDVAAWKIADVRIGLIALIVGWIFQGIGHAVYEKRSPAFTRNLVHLLIGPMFLLNEVVHVRPVMAAGETPALHR